MRIDKTKMVAVAGAIGSFTATLLRWCARCIENRRILTKHLGQVNLPAILIGVALSPAMVWAGTFPGAPEAGRIRAVFLLAQFPELSLDSPRTVFTDPIERTGLVERLADYYAEVSAGRFTIESTVAQSIVTVPKPRTAYVQKPSVMVRDAFVGFLELGDEEASRTALETADAVIVFFAGPGKESDLHGSANDPWSNFTMMTPPLETPRGRQIRLGCVIAANEREALSSFGVLCHEFGHLLGLPELYAPYGASHEGIGVWGLMGQGTWLGRGDRPPHPSAWCKLAMGWADANLVTESGPVTLPAADKTTQVVKIWAKGPEHPKEYFLVENRRREGTDRGLPGAGLLIWHVDERVTGYRTSQSNPDRMRITLMQADGRDDLRVGHRQGGNRGDATDPWRGLDRHWQLALDGATVLGVLCVVAGLVRCRRRGVDWLLVATLACGLAGAVVGLGVSRSPVFGPDTRPSSGSWDGDRGRFTINRISPPGDPMSFTVTFHATEQREPSARDVH